MSFSRYMDWFKEAEDDLEVAQELSRLGRWSKVCFFSHQACEKALKALIMKKFGFYIRTHSVSELLIEVGKRMNISQELIEKCSKLDRYYVPTRYPNAWPALAPHEHYDKKEAEEALRVAEELMNFVKREIESS